MAAPWLQWFSAYLRMPDTVITDDAGVTTAVFTPPLSPAEEAVFDDLKLMAKFAITSDITLAEFQAIKSDLALAKAFLGIASPTNAQAVAAEKSIIRVLGALLRA